MAEIVTFENVLCFDALDMFTTVLINLERQHADNPRLLRAEVYGIIDMLMKIAFQHGATVDDVAMMLGLESFAAMESEAKKFAEEAPEEDLIEAMEVLEVLRENDK